MSKLPFRTKLVFGLAGLGMNLPDLLLLQWLMKRYVPGTEDAVPLVAPRLFAAAYMIGRICEAIYCPIIASWTDNFRSANGRRIPFIRRGIIPFALVVFLLYNPPIDGTSIINFVYLLVLFQAYLFLYSLVVTPYLALLPELTPDVEERVSLTVAQSLFLVVSSVCFAFAGVLIATLGYRITAGIVACIAVLSFVPIGWTVRERQPMNLEDGLPRVPMIRGMLLTLRNPAFLVIAISTAFYWFGLQIIIALVPYWVETVLEKSEAFTTVLMGFFVVFNVASFFLMQKLSSLFGKYRVFLLTLLGSGAVFAMFAGVGAIPVGGVIPQTMLVMAFVGVTVAGFMVLPFALLSDAVDYDERLTGQRREGMFFGVQGIFQKLMIGLGIVTLSNLKGLGNAQADATVAGLKWAAVLAGIACVIGFLVFLPYPLRERHGRVAHVHDNPGEEP
ncbi:MAG TPA: MFS transporter [Candidatus Hydrogenedentes bacterium]|nr:MFS transporter [Candidatus Hydrogenedentota bacterium]HQE83283.1 MFS transporter [Candidatus Hydrogenedentota bacterium]HQH50801.1 MFS transporter [Candidatus Hydrogenedentota bacterium]HQM47739.1 MFS transporter [Candidatus Hydrogenedentota bacterium]